MNIFSIKKIEYIALVAILLCGFISITYAHVCDGFCEEAATWDTLSYYRPITVALNDIPDCFLTINYQARYNPCTGKCEVRIENPILFPAGCTDMTPRDLMEFAGKTIFEHWPPVTQPNQHSYDPLMSSMCSLPNIDTSAEYTVFYAQCVRWEGLLGTTPGGAVLVPCGDTVGCCAQVMYITYENGNMTVIPDLRFTVGGSQCVTHYQPCFFICY